MIVGVAYGQTQVPNTFQAGQPARAADVNNNFSTLESAANQNASDITANATGIQTNSVEIVALSTASGIQVYSAGAPIGRLVAMQVSSSTLSIVGQAIWLLSDEGYLFAMDAAIGNSYLTQSADLYFTGTGCSGDAHTTPVSSVGWAGGTGIVFRGPNGSPLPAYYTPRGGVAVDRLILSLIIGGVCFDTISTQLTYQAFPNDQAVTGVPDTAPVQPLVLGSP